MRLVAYALPMQFNAPLSCQRADQLVELLALSPHDAVLDVGCGQGALLRKVVTRWGCQALGIDIDAAAINAAQLAADEHGLAIHFRCADAKLLPLKPVELAICIGATQAYGQDARAWHNTLTVFSRLVRPGGQILIADGFWARPPDPEYLAFLGESPGIEKTHAENIAAAKALGLTPLYAAQSSPDEWDHFEWSHTLAAERAAMDRPESPAALQQQQRRRRWQAAYEKWGRNTMGFGFYLFGVPAR